MSRFRPLAGEPEYCANCDLTLTSHGGAMLCTVAEAPFRWHKARLLVTRGTQWKGLHKWRVLEMAEEPHLLTCSRRGVMSACLTPHEAARVAFRFFRGAHIYMWDEPNWIPTRSMIGHQAVRVVGALDEHGVLAVAA